MLLLGTAIILKLRGLLALTQRKVLGWLIVVYAIYLSMLTGSYTALVLPGIGKIAIGAGTGAAIGFGAWMVIGTVGVATGGVGIAIGALAMTVIGAFFGGLGGIASGFGVQAISYPLVHWAFWIPILIIGLYFAIGHRLKK